MNDWRKRSRAIPLALRGLCILLLISGALTHAAENPKGSKAAPLIRVTNTSQDSDRARVGGVPVPAAELALPLAPVLAHSTNVPSVTPPPAPAPKALQAPVPVSATPSTAPLPSSPPTASSPKVYLLSPGDRLEMKVFQQPDMTTVSQISEDGTLNLPLLGTVKVAGLSEDQAKRTIRDLYEKDYFVNPEVSLNIVERGKWKYTVTGQVNRPGPYEAMNGETLDLVEAISRAGDFNGKANKSDIRITRREGDRDLPPIYRDADAITRGREPRFEVKPGDKIYVKERLF